MAKVNEPHVPFVAVRLYLRNLFDLLERGREVATGVFAGSVPPGNDELRQFARQRSYDTDLLRRVRSDDERLIEQGVDEILHLKIANALLDHDSPQVLVLATGDGRTSEFGTGFLDQVGRARARDWDVEIYSWSDSMHGEYRRLASRDSHVHVTDLDAYYSSLTFIKGGKYYLQTDGGDDVNVSIDDRIVTPLPDLSTLPL